jgi:hypothetical protein
MNVSFLSIVKRIIAEQGEAVLVDPQRLKAFFSDLAKDEPKPLRTAFGRCIEMGAYTALKDTPDAADRAERKAAIAQRLRDEHGLDITLCGEALDILDAALFSDMKAAPRCVSCGGELRDEWKLCPFCGTAIGAKRIEVAVALPLSHITPESSAGEYLMPNDVSNARLTASNVGAVVGGIIGCIVGAATIAVAADVIFAAGVIGAIIGAIIIFVIVGVFCSFVGLVIGAIIDGGIKRSKP